MPITNDKQGRPTGRFGGIQWEPPQSWLSRGYVTGKWQEGFNSANDVKYGDFIPAIYGTTWIDPLVVNIVGDANLTAMEAVLCAGEVDTVLRVIVNDVAIAESGRGGDLVGGFWNFVNKGGRDGSVNADTFYDGTGDPYGSLATVHIRVPKALAGSGSTPRVRVLVRGPKLRVYSGPTTYSFQYSENPAWVLIDLLLSSGWRAEEVDIASFIAAAGVCSQPVSFESQHGGSSLRDRYSVSMSIRQRRSAADLIRGVRNACKGVLFQGQQGLLQLAIKQTLADQQPSPIAGSNEASPLASISASGATAQGYAAYHFDDSGILLVNGASSLRVRQRDTAETPNHLRLTIQDEENGYEPDMLSEFDTEELIRVGQEIAQSPSVEGLTSYDQGRRVLGTLFAEAYRGNPRGDTGGTWQFEWESSIKAAHLCIGQIVLLSSAKLGLVRQPVRLTRIQPSADFQTVRLAGHWHEDAWYLDAYGQGGGPGYSGQNQRNLIRPPFGWQPYHSAPLPGDSMYAAGEYTFGLKPHYETAADGTAIGKAQVRGILPVNAFTNATQPPFLPLQGTTSPTGGHLSGGQTYWVAIVAKDEASTAFYGCTPPSNLCRIDVPDGGETHTVTVPILKWPSGAAGYLVFAGTDPGDLTYQDEQDATPSSITLGGPLKVKQWGLPDTQFSRLRLRAKKIARAGVAEALITSASSTAIVVDDARWTVNQWAGYDCSVLGFGSGDAESPILNMRIAGNTGDTLTLAPGAPDPVAAGVQPGDFVVIRSRPAASSASRIQDAGWDNSLSLDPLMRIEALTGGSSVTLAITAHGLSTGDRVRVNDVGGLSGADGVVAITKIDDDHFVLNGVSGGVLYSSGGSVQKLTGGLRTDEAAGKILRVLAGTGRGQTAKIASNTATELLLETPLAVGLDQTSRYIIEEPEWLSEIETSVVDNYYANRTSQWDLECSNLPRQPLLVQCATVNPAGQESLPSLSPVRETYFPGSIGDTGGFRGGLAVSVPGVLAIGSDVGPPLSFALATRAQKIRLSVKQAPLGSDVIVSVYLNGNWYSTLAIPAGAKSGETTKATTNLLPDIPEGAVVRLDIVQVGTAFPGADLTCSIFT